MKITFEILGILLLVLAASSTTMYFIQRKREKKAQLDGVVVYATLVSATPLRGLAKVNNMHKIVLRVQEPNSEPRDVTIRSGMEAGQKFSAGARIPVVIDPANPKRVYPANAESAKRAVFTGSRQERRGMQSQLRSPGRRGQRPPSGYQPPISKIR